MKNTGNPFKTALILGLAILCSASLFAQQDNKAAAVKNLVEGQRYVFRAETVFPMGGRTRQLTSEYTVRISKDTVESFLPYFGRAYTAPMDPSKGGIQFLSKKFGYTVTGKKKGGWDVLVKPQDVQDVQQLNFSISESGYASLQVISNNRQPISFNGYITAVKDRKKKK